MEALADVMLATVDLVEAEGRALRRTCYRLAIAGLLLLVALLLVLAGLGFLLFALFWVAAAHMSVPWAAALFGGVALALAGGIGWTARRLTA